MAKPNVILIMTDNQQAAALGCYGNPEIHSPNVDALAAGGLRFDKAFCPNAFCSACRASAMTGMLPSQHGVHSWIDDRNMQAWPGGWHALGGLATLPEQMHALGYRTGIFGKYHLGETATPGPGWDRWVTMEHGHVRSFYNNQIRDDGQTYTQPGHAVDFFTDKALEYLAGEEPTFAYLPYPAPYGHWPATNDGIPNRFTDLYADCPMETIPRRGLSKAAVDNYNMVQAGSGGGLDFSMLLRAPNDMATLRNYYSQISMIDEAVGRIADCPPGRGDHLHRRPWPFAWPSRLLGPRRVMLAIEPAPRRPLDPADRAHAGRGCRRDADPRLEHGPLCDDHRPGRRLRPTRACPVGPSPG